MKQKNWVLEYWQQIESGKINVPKKIHRWYKYLAGEVLSPTTDYHYDSDRGQHVIDFFEVFIKHSKGEWAGRPVKLELWQKAMLAGCFGFVDDDGIRRFQRLILIIAKKNGKSLLGSGIALYGLIADGEGGAEIYAVATKKDQAKIVWDESKKMLNKSPALKKRTRSLVTGIHYDATESEYKALASDADSLDGKNVHMVLMDEIHQWKNGRALYDIMADGIASRQQPMIVIMSTAGVIREDIYDEIYDEVDVQIKELDIVDGYRDLRTYPLVYELDDIEEWLDPDCWIKANPNLGVSKSREYLLERVQRAQKNAAARRNLLTKEFNMPQSAATSLFDMEDIYYDAKFDFAKMKPDYAVGGFDLSVRGDLTAAVLIFTKKNDPTLYVESMFWMPEDALDAHVRSDGVPYDVWHKQGFLQICPGNQVDYDMVSDWFEEMRDKHELIIPWIGYDPAYASWLVDKMKTTFGEGAMQVIRQGFMTLGMPFATIEKMIRAHQVNYNENPIMRYCLMCLSVEEDRNGNIMPSKRKSNVKRIDGFSAMLNAWAVLSNNREQYDRLLDYADD